MNDWLHCLGRVHYSWETWSQEAQAVGWVSRRVSLSLLGAFSWRDYVWVGQGGRGGKPRKSSGIEVWGYFQVEGLGGVSPEDAASLQSLGALTHWRDGGQHLCLHSGTYTLGSLFQSRASLLDLVPFLTQDSFPLLLGTFHPLTRIAILPDQGYFRGYKRFHGQAFLQAYARELEGSGGSWVEVAGRFPRAALPPSTPEKCSWGWVSIGTDLQIQDPYQRQEGDRYEDESTRLRGDSRSQGA